jgi:hypothetical protein
MHALWGTIGRMQERPQDRFKFISHALAGDGPFRPVPSYPRTGQISTAIGLSYLVKYPRESDDKFARRNEIAFFDSPLAEACQRFAGYISTREASRDLPSQLYVTMADDIDGKANSLDVFWQDFMVQAKARGSMLLLVDMPQVIPSNQGAQLQTRALPYWTMIRPEFLHSYRIAENGKFEFAKFTGTYVKDGEDVPCVWHFDRAGWAVRSDTEEETFEQGEHGLGECPLLIFTESSDFPCFGSFASIADLSRRLFNLDSELDEILRSQTFSLLTMHVPEDAAASDKLTAARVAGETIGTNNLMVHSGSTPAFIAPPDGPARIYMDRIKQMWERIDRIGLNVASVNAQESGIAMQMRFAAINGELARFASRMEDLERRAWELSGKWLRLDARPAIEWPRDFNVRDLAAEMKVLQDMQSTAMPQPVISEQQKRIVSLQFPGLEQTRQDELNGAIDERLLQLE